MGLEGDWNNSKYLIVSRKTKDVSDRTTGNYSFRRVIDFKYFEDNTNQHRVMRVTKSDRGRKQRLLLR